METASDQAPAAQGSLDSSADTKPWARRNRAPNDAYLRAAPLLRNRRLELGWTLDELAERLFGKPISHAPAELRLISKLGLGRG